jgi:hypothetical protein
MPYERSAARLPEPCLGLLPVLVVCRQRGAAGHVHGFEVCFGGSAVLGMPVMPAQRVGDSELECACGRAPRDLSEGPGAASTSQLCGMCMNFWTSSCCASAASRSGCIVARQRLASAAGSLISIRVLSVVASVFSVELYVGLGVCLLRPSVQAFRCVRRVVISWSGREGEAQAAGGRGLGPAVAAALLYVVFCTWRLYPSVSVLQQKNRWARPTGRVIRPGGPVACVLYFAVGSCAVSCSAILCRAVVRQLTDLGGFQVMSACVFRAGDGWSV